VNDWNAWKQQMRVAIQAASIVRECHDKMARGLGALDPSTFACREALAAALEAGKDGGR
jgi:hypothetical protein